MAETGFNDDSSVNYWRVLQNVLCIFTVIASIAVSTSGFIYMNDCSSDLGLPINLAVQGFVTISLPVWFLLVYRTRIPIGKNIFYTVFITLFIVFLICLVTCTRFLAISGCSRSEVFTISVVSFGTIWLLFLVFTLSVFFWKFCCRH